MYELLEPLRILSVFAQNESSTLAEFMLKIDETVQQLENQIKTNLGTSKTEKNLIQTTVLQLKKRFIWSDLHYLNLIFNPLLYGKIDNEKNKK